MSNRVHRSQPPVAVVTGASAGLGLALARALVGSGWRLVVDARDAARLATATATLGGSGGEVTAVVGDVSDHDHRLALLDAVRRAGALHLLVNNASVLGPSPLVPLADQPLDVLERVYAVNVLAPLALVQLLLPRLELSAGRIVNISSDAAVEPYAGWGGYGSAKAALDQLSAVLAVEHPDLRIYALDPGDMATDMHQQAYVGEDVSDRPDPETVVPALLRLVAGDLPSGRYRAGDLLLESAPAR